jgi:hypothetical protein
MGLAFEILTPYPTSGCGSLPVAALDSTAKTQMWVRIPLSVTNPKNASDSSSVKPGSSDNVGIILAMFGNA